MSTAVSTRRATLIYWHHWTRFPRITRWYTSTMAADSTQHKDIGFCWEAFENQGCVVFRRDEVQFRGTVGKGVLDKDWVPAVAIVRHGDFATILLWINQEVENRYAYKSLSEDAPSSGANGRSPVPIISQGWPPKGSLHQFFQTYTLAVLGICYEPNGKSFATIREIFRELGYTVYEFPSWGDYWSAIEAP